MSKNIHKVIKVLAIVMFVMGALGSVISGIVLIADLEDYGVVLILCGTFGSFVTSTLIYGFGQLIEDTSAIRGVVSPPIYPQPVVQQPVASAPVSPVNPLNGAVSNIYADTKEHTMSPKAIAKLKKYKSLLDEGKITEDEFEDWKAYLSNK